MLGQNRAFNYTISKIYYERFLEYGSNAKSSFWVSKKTQELRFEIILRELAKIVQLTAKPVFHLADVGCGYGALSHYLEEQNDLKHFTYSGYDISQKLINECKSKNIYDWAEFDVATAPVKPTMFTIMSGTYNLAPTTNLILWEQHVEACLQSCWDKTLNAMVFNMQVAEKARISKNKIYYTNAIKMVEICVARFGPTKIVRDNKLPNDATFVVRK